MGFDLPVFVAAGIQDALGPVQAAVAGIYALMLLFLRQGTKSTVIMAAGLFIGTLWVFGVLLDLKFFDPLLVASIFLDHASWFFLVIGSALLFAGFLFLREWYVFVPGSLYKLAAFMPTPVMGRMISLILSFFLAAGLAFVSSSWPVNYQVLVQGEMAVAAGTFVHSLGAFFIYEFFRNIDVLFVLLFFILAQGKKNAVFLRQQMSLVLVIISALYVAIGGSLVWLFLVAATK